MQGWLDFMETLRCRTETPEMLALQVPLNYILYHTYYVYM